MPFTKYARFDSGSVLGFYSAPSRLKHASLTHISEFDRYRTHDGYLYARVRAISSRVNHNFDSWPSAELAGSSQILNQHRASDGGFVVEANKGAQYGFSTFLGKPLFVDHHNSDPSRARGIIVDAKLHVEDFKTASLDPFYASNEAEDYHLPPTWIELMLEVDAQSYPKYAKAIKEGAEDPNKGVDGFSMGVNCKRSRCNICSNIATEPHEFCQHVLAKGALFSATNTRTGHKVMKKAAEACEGLMFFELSAIPSPSTPADETALTQSLVYASRRIAKTAKTAVELPREYSDENSTPPDGFTETSLPEDTPEFQENIGAWTVKWNGGPYAEIYHAEYPTPLDVINLYDYEKGGVDPNAPAILPQLFQEWVSEVSPDYQRQLPYMARKMAKIAETIPGYDAYKLSPPPETNGYCEHCQGPLEENKYTGEMVCPECGPQYQSGQEEQMSPSGHILSKWNSKMKVASFMKGAPDAGDDEYFGSKPGSAKKTFDNIVKEYGHDKGEEVYYALRNKNKGKKSSAGECPQCHSLLDPEHKGCRTCGYVNPLEVI